MLTIPDFRGNRFFNTLGNLVLDAARGPAVRRFRDRRPAAPAGRVEIDWEPPGGEWPEGVQRQWRFTVERAWRRPAALPLRWAFGDYSPVTLMTSAWNAAA